jgi:hypothetical protein
MTLADVWILQDGDLDLIKDASISLAGHGQYMWVPWSLQRRSDHPSLTWQTVTARISTSSHTTLRRTFTRGYTPGTVSSCERQSSTPRRPKRILHGPLSSSGA